jgi:cell division protein FtsL
VALMFLRILAGLSMLVLIGSAVAVYKVKYDTTYEVQRIAKLRSEIRSEREKLALLRAEWMRLSAPQRIQELATRHLGMKPLEVARISDFSSLPEKPRGEEDRDPIGEFIGTLAGESTRDSLGDFLRALNGESKSEGASPGASR